MRGMGNHAARPAYMVGILVEGLGLLRRVGMPTMHEPLPFMIRTLSASTTTRSPKTMINNHTSPKPATARQPSGEWLDDTPCSGLVDLTRKRRKRKIQKNSPLRDKGLLRVIFANEAKTRGNPI